MQIRISEWGGAKRDLVTIDIKGKTKTDNRKKIYGTSRQKDGQTGTTTQVSIQTQKVFI